MWAQVQSGFTAPAQRMVNFCEGRSSSALPRTSYAPGIKSVALHEALPGAVSRRLRKAFPQVKIKGYYTNEALLLGVESRTSSPVRLPRDPQTLEYYSFPGIFPCGEGAGYAGGIVSSAVDGIRAAESVAQRFGINYLRIFVRYAGRSGHIELEHEVLSEVFRAWDSGFFGK